MLGEDAAPAGFADLVPGPADALQATGHRARRLDLDDEVDRAHVDAQLEAAGGDQRPEVPPLQLVLDLKAALPAEGAVMGLDQLVAGWRRATLGLGRPALAVEVELVQPGGEALGQTAGVDEDDGRPVLEDQLEQPGVHRGPDGAAHRTGRGGALDGLVDDLAQAAHVLDRDDDLDLQRLAHAGVDDGDRARAAFGLAAEEAGDLVERALGGRQADALGRLLGPLLEPLEGERQVGAPLGRRPGRGSRR